MQCTHTLLGASTCAAHSLCPSQDGTAPGSIQLPNRPTHFKKEKKRLRFMGRGLREGLSAWVRRPCGPPPHILYLVHLLHVVLHSPQDGTAPGSIIHMQCTHTLLGASTCAAPSLYPYMCHTLAVPFAGRHGPGVHPAPQ